jgi:hypothetical protein
MHIEWYGQSSFRLTDGSTTVFIDPFADMTPALDRGLRWDYPAISGVEADLLLVTHRAPIGQPPISRGVIWTWRGQSAPHRRARPPSQRPAAASSSAPGRSCVRRALAAGARRHSPTRW